MSTSETQSMVLLQAMASGIPVVAADARALPEFVGPSNGVLVGPARSRAAGAGARGSAGLAGAAAPFGSAGRHSAERYGVEAVTDEWETLYRSVLKGSAAE